MTCPNCQNPRIRHAKSFAIHFFRLISGSHKYYCGNCGQKWCARPRFKKSSLAGLFTLTFILAYAANFTLDAVMERWHQSQLGQQTAAAMTVLSDEKLMKKINKAGGNPMEVLKQLDSSERQKIKNYMKSSSTSSQSGAIKTKLQEMGIQVDDATMARISQFSGDPKSAYNALSSEEKKRVKNELAKANIDPRNLNV